MLILKSAAAAAPNPYVVTFIRNQLNVVRSASSVIRRDLPDVVPAGDLTDKLRATIAKVQSAANDTWDAGRRAMEAAATLRGTVVFPEPLDAVIRGVTEVFHDVRLDEGYLWAILDAGTIKPGSEYMFGRIAMHADEAYRGAEAVLLEMRRAEWKSPG